LYHRKLSKNSIKFFPISRAISLEAEEDGPLKEDNRTNSQLLKEIKKLGLSLDKIDTKIPVPNRKDDLQNT